MTDEIERFYAKLEPDDYVLECVAHEDHLAAMQAKDAEIARLTTEVKLLQENYAELLGHNESLTCKLVDAEAALKEERDTSALVFEDTANIVAKLKAALQRKAGE